MTALYWIAFLSCKFKHSFHNSNNTCKAVSMYEICSRARNQVLFQPNVNKSFIPESRSHHFSLIHWISDSDYELHWSRLHLVSLLCRPPWSCTGYQSRANLNEIRKQLYLKLSSGSLCCPFRMDRWKLIAPCFFPCRRISKTWWKHPHVVVQLRRVNIQVFHINILLFALETFWAPMSTRACWRKVKISKQYGGVI